MFSSPHTPRRTRPPSSTRPSPSPARTPLGPSRSLPLSRSKSELNSTTKQFVDQHSKTYAHLYEYDDEATKREKLDLEEKRLDEERRIGREMRERLKEMERINNGSGEKGKGWRPLSLVAKRQPNGLGLGHARSASATHTSTTNVRSVSTPLPSNRVHPDRSHLSRDSDKLEVVVERSDSPTPSHRSSRDVQSPAMSSQNHSTYSWATSFSGETAELRTTAQYIRKSLDCAPMSSPSRICQGDEGGEEEIMEDTTPDKVKRRRKRIVALAHTVRQLEGVGSREAEDPNFYGVLVKAWNERPGMTPAPSKAKAYPPSGNGLTEGPPDLLPPPNLPTYSYPPRTHYSPNPNFDNTPTTTFSPPDQYIHTPALGFGSSSSSSTPRLPGIDNGLYISADDAESILESEMGSDERGLRGFRYSYASALHDLALEEQVESREQVYGQGQRDRQVKEGKKAYGKGRWSGAWEGWSGATRSRESSRMPRMSGSNQTYREGMTVPDQIQSDRYPSDLDYRTHDHLTRSQTPIYHPSRPTSRPLTPASSGQPAESTPKSGWGLGFMSAWWADRPSSQLLDDAQGLSNAAHDVVEQGMAGADFQSGEEESLRPIKTLTQKPQHQHQQQQPIPTSTPNRPTSLVSAKHGSLDHVTPSSPEIDRSYTLTADSYSGTSTPSFGSRIHASAERRWIDAQSAKPKLRVNVGMTELDVGVAGGEVSPSPWREPMLGSPPPPETGWSDITINTAVIDHVLGYTGTHHPIHPGTSVTPSVSYTTTSSIPDGEGEFPFTKHCQPPSPGSGSLTRPGSARTGIEMDTPLTTDSSFISAKLGMAAVLQARALREAMAAAAAAAAAAEEEKEEKGKQLQGEGREYLVGSENGLYHSKPHFRTLDKKEEKMEVLLPPPKVQSQQADLKGLLQRRKIGPLRLDDILNPVLSSDHPPPSRHVDLDLDQIRGIELQSSISHNMYSTISGSSPAMMMMTKTTSPSTATTPSSAQTVFLPPHGTPIESLTPTDITFPRVETEDHPAKNLPSREGEIQGISSGSGKETNGEITEQYPWGRKYLSRPLTLQSHRRPDQSSDPSSYRSDSIGPGLIGGTAPVRPVREPHSLHIDHDTERDVEIGEQVGYRDPTPSVRTAISAAEVQPRKRNWSPILFWLGFIMPWCWVFGGWPIISNFTSNTNPQMGEQDIEKSTTGTDTLTGKSYLTRWTYHPDPWVRRCRFAAGMGLPSIAFLAVIAVVGLAAIRR